MAVPVTVQTIAGQSGSLDATYAGIPTVGGVTATAGPTTGQPAGPDTGGTPIDVTGEGFAGQVLGIAFVDALGPFSISHAVQLHGAQQHRSHVVDGAAESGARRRHGLHGDGVLLPVALA